MKKLFRLIIALVVTIFIGWEVMAVEITPAGSDSLFTIEENNQWGYIDRSGKVVIPPRFVQTGVFAGGLAPVMVGKKYGYIDMSGNLVIKPQFENAWSFYDGLAAVQVGKRYGFIDKTGRKVIAAKYDDLWDFSEGLAAVKYRNLWGFIDRSGREVIKPQFAWAASFSEGLAAVSDGNKFGFIDETGNYKIPLVYERAWGFSQGLAAVKLNDKYGFIDKTAKMVIQPTYDEVYNFSEGLAVFNVGGTKGLLGNLVGGKWGYLDRNGKVVVRPQFEGAASFSGGFAAVNSGGVPNSMGILSGGKWGYLDSHGNLAINMQFDDAYGFTDGMANVLVNEKWGWIDRTGRYIWASENIIKKVKVDFASSGTGFNEAGIWQIRDGELRFNGGSIFHYNFYPIKVYSDFQLKVRAKWAKEVDNTGFGIVFRGTDVANYYAFLITSNGFYKLSKVVDNLPQKVVDLTKTDLIRQDFNNLEVVCKGTAISCRINGQEVINIKEEQAAYGYVYVGVGSNPQVECKFDDFEVVEEE